MFRSGIINKLLSVRNKLRRSRFSGEERKPENYSAKRSSLPIFATGHELNLVIEEVKDGYGIAHVNNFPIRVDDTQVGQRLKVKILKSNKYFARARKVSDLTSIAPIDNLLKKKQIVEEVATDYVDNILFQGFQKINKFEFMKMKKQVEKFAQKTERYIPNISVEVQLKEYPKTSGRIKHSVRTKVIAEGHVYSSERTSWEKMDALHHTLDSLSAKIEKTFNFSRRQKAPSTKYLTLSRY